MTNTTQDTIAINAITRAIDTMVNAGITYDAACDDVRKLRATDKLSVPDARSYIQAALLSKVPEYKDQRTERGFPAQDSAYARAVTRLMRDTSPETAEHANHSEGVKKASKRLTSNEKALREYMAGIVAELTAQGWTKTDIKAAI